MIIVGVRTLIDILFYPYRFFSFSRSSGEGYKLHLQLGYNQPNSFSKVIGNVIIQGKPDKIENGTVIELKTIQSKEQMHDILAPSIFQVQVYCFLTGLDHWKIVFYETPTKKTYVKRGKFRKTETLTMLENALSKFLEIRKILGLET